MKTAQQELKDLIVRAKELVRKWEEQGRTPFSISMLEEDIADAERTLESYTTSIQVETQIKILKQSVI